MPSASVCDSDTAGLPAARETRRRGLKISEIFADSSGNGVGRERAAGRGGRRAISGSGRSTTLDYSSRQSRLNA